MILATERNSVQCRSVTMLNLTCDPTSIYTTDRHLDQTLTMESITPDHMFY